MSTKKVWFVTGASKGLGLTLVKKLLAEGYSVAATSRNISELQKAISEENASFLPLEVDLINENSVESAVSKSIEKFGKLDVVVNNWLKYSSVRQYSWRLANLYPSHYH